jgi:hypothetical protein
VLDAVSDVIDKYEYLILVEECDSRVGLVGTLLTELARLGISKRVKLCGGSGDIGSSRAAEENTLLTKEKIKKAILGL